MILTKMKKITSPKQERSRRLGYPKWIISSLVLGCVALSGCAAGPGNQANTTSSSAANANSSNTSVQSGNGQGSTSTGTANQAGVGTNQAGNDVSQSGSGNGASSSGTNSAGGTDSSDASSSGVQLVDQTMALAKQGKLQGVPFAQRSNMGSVYQTWGKADSQSSAGAGTYATYGSHNVALGFNKGVQIFDLRSYSATFQGVTFADIQQALGNPGAVRQSSDSYIYMYPAGPDYQLLWVFSKQSDGSRAPNVDHVSVFWPQGTVDLMAQNDPQPRVIVDNKPGRQGSLFTFSIQNSPNDYHLAEFEWIPNKGSAVVTTFSQATDNGQTGAQNPGFEISGDGKTLSFTYTSALKGQSGTVRLIYQNTAGGALIGESSSITLK